MPDHFKHLKREIEMIKLKRDVIVVSSEEDEKKVKVKSAHYAKIIGGLDCHLELLMDKIGKLCGQDWARNESEKT